MEQTPGQRFRALLERTGPVPAVYGIPTAIHAKLMQAAGVEVGFVGGVSCANYTGFTNTSMHSMAEFIQICGYIAQAVEFPVILDVDTGPGSLTALERLVADCIRAGIACLRFEDQIPGMKRQWPAVVDVLSMEDAVVRYRCAADARDALDPSFVLGAKSYARLATNGSLEDATIRLQAYLDAGADWVQLESPKSLGEIRYARERIDGPFAIRGGPRLDVDECAELGLCLAWFNDVPQKAIEVAAWELLKQVRADGIGAMERFASMHEQSLGEIEELKLFGSDRLAELEARYYGTEAAAP